MNVETWLMVKYSKDAWLIGISSYLKWKSSWSSVDAFVAGLVDSCSWFIYSSDQWSGWSFIGPLIGRHLCCSSTIPIGGSFDSLKMEGDM